MADYPAPGAPHLKTLMPPECQKVNSRRIKRAISKLLKALHHEVKGGLHVVIGYEIPIIDDSKGSPQIVRGTEYYRPAEKSTKGKARKGRK